VRFIARDALPVVAEHSSQTSVLVARSAYGMSCFADEICIYFITSFTLLRQFRYDPLLCDRREFKRLINSIVDRDMFLLSSNDPCLTCHCNIDCSIPLNRIIAVDGI
jgi:hypothetical protein